LCRAAGVGGTAHLPRRQVPSSKGQRCRKQREGDDDLDQV
jgi:hypothetical protein